MVINVQFINVFYLFRRYSLLYESSANSAASCYIMSFLEIYMKPGPNFGFESKSLKSGFESKVTLNRSYLETASVSN